MEYCRGRSELEASSERGDRGNPGEDLKMKIWEGSRFDQHDQLDVTEFQLEIQRERSIIPPHLLVQLSDV